MKKPKQKRLDGRKKCLAFTQAMQADIRAFCRDKGIESESELIRQAVAKYIYSDYKDETLKLQGLKQIHEKQAELRDMMEILFIYTRLMHIDTLSYHPELGKEIADAALKSAVMRHDKFFNALQESLKNNPPFFEKLLHKYYTEVPDVAD